MHVIVEFHGLMVFGKRGCDSDKSKPCENVGILTDKEHKFQVLLDGAPQISKSLPRGALWSLLVTNSSPSVIRSEEEHDRTRKNDDRGLGQFDFSWIVDLGDLHSTNPTPDLKPKSGAFNPVIQLHNGVLHSLYKTPFMERTKGDSKGEEFGYMTETVGLIVDVNKGQNLVLKEDNGTKRFIFRPLAYAPTRTHTIVIKNVRDDSNIANNASDFHCYYDAFEKIVEEGDKYDFNVLKSPTSSPTKPPPYNPVPPKLTTTVRQGNIHKLTCCGMDCNSISASKAMLR
jgi:hypothetical protein